MEKDIEMRTIALAVVAILLIGCGVESAGTAAIAAKQQAEQAQQAKATLDKTTKRIDAAMSEAEQNRKKAEEAAQD